MILYEEMTCPFCHEDNFDDMGLKDHLLRSGCNVFNAVPLKEGTSTTRSTDQAMEEK